MDFPEAIPPVKPMTKPDSDKRNHVSGYNGGVKRPGIVFVHSDGRRQALAANIGDSIMDCALDNGVPGIEAQCGGACLCSTCHCYVEAPWLGRLPPMIDDEQALLGYLEDGRDNSRLSCQLFMTPDLDGIVVHIPESQWRGQ